MILEFSQTLGDSKERKLVDSIHNIKLKATEYHGSLYVIWSTSKGSANSGSTLTFWPYFFSFYYFPAMVWMCVFPKNSYAKILTPNVMVFGSGVFGRWLGHESAALMNGISSHKKDPRKLLYPHITMSVSSKKIRIYDPGS